MVNHAYTLLLNLPGEYIPKTTAVFDVYRPQYSSKEIPSGLLALGDTLFNGCTTDELRQQRAYLLMFLLSGSVFKDTGLDQDTRITYKFPDSFSTTVFTTGLGEVLERFEILSDTTLLGVFSGLPNEKLFYYSAGTFIDKLAALTSAYIKGLY